MSCAVFAVFEGEFVNEQNSLSDPETSKGSRAVSTVTSAADPAARAKSGETSFQRAFGLALGRES